MAIKPTLSLGHLLVKARQTLSMTQAKFGPALGASHRTAARWDAGRAKPDEHELRKLAELLVPRDLALAAEAAAHAGDTLLGLGLVEPPPPPPMPSPPPPRSRPEDLVDVVLCAVANHTGSVPETMRPLLHTAFRRAREVGLTVEEVEQALAPPEVAKGAPSAKGRAAAKG